MSALARSLALLAVCLLASAFAHAAPTAGGVLPTPEVMPPGTYELQLEAHGPQLLQADESRYTLGLQASPFPQLEVGVDVRLGTPWDAWPSKPYRDQSLGYDPDAEGTDEVWFNAKLQLLTEGRSAPALAVGFVNIGASGPTGNYFSVGKHTGRLGIAIGGAKLYDNNHVFEIITWRLNDSNTFVAEHLSGGRFSTNFVLQRQLSEQWRLKLGWLRSNTSLMDHEVLVNLTYTGNLGLGL